MSLIEIINNKIEEIINARILNVCEHFKIDKDEMAGILRGERLVWDMSDAFLNANTLEELDEVWKSKSEVLLKSIKSEEDKRKIKEDYERRKHFLKSGELLEEEYV